MNKGTFIVVSEKKYLVRTIVGNTYFTYETDENSFFEDHEEYMSNAAGLRIEATILN